MGIYNLQDTIQCGKSPLLSRNTLMRYGWIWAKILIVLMLYRMRPDFVTMTAAMEATVATHILLRFISNSFGESHHWWTHINLDNKFLHIRISFIISVFLSMRASTTLNHDFTVNNFRISDPFCGYSVGHPWIPITKSQLWRTLVDFVATFHKLLKSYLTWGTYNIMQSRGFSLRVRTNPFVIWRI